MTSTRRRSPAARLLAVLVAAPAVTIGLVLPAGATPSAAPVLTSPAQAVFSPGQSGSFQLSAAGTPAPAISLGADAQAIAELDPSAWWDLSDPAGSTTARDASGQGGTGTVTGDPVTFGQPGPPGDGPETAAAFDGSSYLSTDVSQPAVSGATVLAWFETSSSTSNQVIISSRDGNGTNDLELAVGNGEPGNVFFGMDESSRQVGLTSTDDAYGDGRWHLAVGVWSGSSGQLVTPSQFALYVDGEPVATTSSSVNDDFTAPLATGEDFWVGYNDGNGWQRFDGDLAQVAVVPYALTAAQAQGLYEAATGAGPFPDGLSFAAGSDGTATLSGTPPVTSSGSYTIPVVASNGVSPVATQQLDLGVGTAPEITSSGSASCTVGSACTFSLTASGEPAPSWSEAGVLPSGMTFTDDGDGTATLSGSVGADGQWPITVTASNGISPDAVQELTLTATGAPSTTTTTTTSVPPPPVPAFPSGFGLASSGPVPDDGPMTLTATSGSIPTSATLAVPGGVLPAGSVVGLATLGTDPSTPAGLPREDALRAGFAVSWAGSGGTVPTAAAPLAVTIAGSGVVAGERVYEEGSTGGAPALVAVVRASGSVGLEIASPAQLYVLEPPLLSVASRGVPVSVRRALVKLSCSSGLLCRGSATLSVARHPAGSGHATHPAVARARVSLGSGEGATISFRLTAFGARRLDVARFRHGEPFAVTLLVVTASGQRLVERLHLHVRLRT